MGDIGNLVDHGIVHGCRLTENRRTRDVGERRGVDVRRVLRGDHDDIVVDVGVGEVRGLGAFRIDRHTSADDVNLAAVERVDETREIKLHGNGIEIELLGDELGNLNVIAIGVSTGKRSRWAW